jgi:hypothetical protein
VFSFLLACASADSPSSDAVAQVLAGAGPAEPQPSSSVVESSQSGTIAYQDSNPQVPVPTARIVVTDVNPTLSTSVSQSQQLALLNITVSQKYSITSMICADAIGPDCSKLRLGDEFLTTITPAKGYLYSCNEKNPSAPGVIVSKLTWVNFLSNTWDFFKKPWLPSGAFDPGKGEYSENTLNSTRNIVTNNLPLDGNIGDWPMTNYHDLTMIDRNPGVPEPGNMAFAYSVTPTEAVSPSCVSLGAIGVSTNGVILYNAVDARGEDAVAREILDEFGGHPSQTTYHYHFIPERFDDVFLEDGHSSIVGYINDGFPIYGYQGVGGIEMTNADLDICHGHDHESLGYHYHATIEYPYTIGCYKGEPVARSQRNTVLRERQGRLPRTN